MPLFSNEELNAIVNDIQEEVDNFQTEETPETPVEVAPDLREGEIFSHTVESIPIYMKEPDGGFAKVPDFHGVNRKRKNGFSLMEILHVAPDTTTVIGMEQLESIAYELVDLGYSITGSGELRQNKWLFVELENEELPELDLPGTKLVPKQWIGSSHDGTLALKSTLKVIDTICENTFMMNAKSMSLFKTKHTKNAQYRIKEYRQGIQEAGEVLNQYYDSVKMLSEAPCNNPEPYFTKVLGAEMKPRKRTLNGKQFMTEPQYSGKHLNQLRALDLAFKYGDGQQERGNTLWRAFSAVTDWADHDEANEKANANGSNILGTRARQKEKAFNLAVDLATGMQVAQVPVK